MPAVLAAVLLLTLGSTAAAQTPPADVRLLDLASIRQLFNLVARQQTRADEGERAAAWADFSMLVDAVAGHPAGESLAFDDLAADASGSGRTVRATPGVIVRAAPGVAARDAAAYQLLALGYSTREAADVVSGRISQRALDTARRMLAVGQAREAAANYLDSQYTRVIAMRNRRNGPAPRAMPHGPFDAVIEQYAGLYHVSAALVRAMIMTESAFDPGARSPAGAIGLMQLMPATARELGVNPRIPEQNIEGGVRYFSNLIRMFGGTELALIAYNGGPGFARRYARRETALYGETRDYVKRVLGRVAAAR